MSLRLSPTIAILPLLLIACDRQADESAQEQAELTGAKASLGKETAKQANGKNIVEIDRSHAGEVMPAELLRDPNGRELNTGALQGAPVLLNLWATWCAPCRAEMPMLDDIAAEYDGALRVVTVSQDRKGADKVVPVFAKAGFKHLEPWLDPEAKLDRALQGKGLPISVLYDSQGLEVWRVEGEYDWTSAESREAIDEAL